MERLSPQRRTQALELLSAWSLVEGRDAITRSLRWDFNAAFGSWPRRARGRSSTITPVVQCHNRVDITLSTHDAGGLTELDVTLAQQIDALAARGVVGACGCVEPHAGAMLRAWSGKPQAMAVTPKRRTRERIVEVGLRLFNDFGGPMSRPA